MKISIEAVKAQIAKNKYVLAVLALGLALILLPSGAGSSGGDGGGADGEAQLLSEGEALSRVLSEIEGVGRASVIVSERGAVVVCDGADDPATRLSVTNAVGAYTGLGSDKITVVKRSNNQ